MSMSVRPRPAVRPSTGSGPRRVAAVTRPGSAAQHSSTKSTTPSLTNGRSTESLSGSSKGKDAEGNINVVVRCRGLSSRETNTTLVAKVEKTRGSTVTLVDPDPTNTSSSSQAKGTAATAATRTYDFGDRHVYGEDANQSMIYMDVAKPILEQVLQGYNCTIFAYGQTGTGKTYTMEGDLTSAGGTFSTEAGVIPRVLYGLFQRLAEDGVEFSVKCSFVELYNEELRDLNGLDYIEQTSQPMSKGAKPTGGLKIFDDKSAGVVIQGLEETLIMNAEEGIAVLNKGSERRQIAATKCNDRSSRSHSIFSLVIHTKELSKTGGEDLLKVGKLNLVDLAGSENVQRSGAENDTAREAGIINASLLALGRVINKLVEKQTHIPYRDSKLTRLLQDSLGGRTKTTIIATISPVNFEETTSTLDYASRAKTIQNRPELNARMTKGLLLSQFALEIQRLKEDLLAVREKNGIYFSAQSWGELSAEQDQRKLQLEEAKRRAEVFESNFQGASDQLAQNLMLLGVTQQELEMVMARQRRTKGEVVRLAEELLTTKGELEGQTVLREAFEQSREGWKGAAAEALEDVEGLRAKLERKSTVEAANLATVTTASASFTQVTDTLQSQLTNLHRHHETFSRQLRGELSAFASREAETLASHVALVDSRLASLEHSSQTVVGTAGAIATQGTSFLELVETTRQELVHTITAQSEVALEAQAERGQQMIAGLGAWAEEMAATIGALAGPMEALRDECEAGLEEQVGTLVRVEAEEQAALKAENARLERLVAQLSQALEAERRANATEDDELVALLAAQLASRSARRNAALTESHDLAVADVTGLAAERLQATRARRVQLESVRQRSQAMASVLQHQGSQVEEVKVESEARMAEYVRQLQAEVGGLMEVVEQVGQAQAEAVEEAGRRFEVGAATFRTDASTSRATFDQALGAMLAETKETIGLGREQAEAVGSDVGNTSASLQATLESHSFNTTSSLVSASTLVCSLHASIDSSLSSALRHDLPTGQTPQKRAPPTDALHATGIDLDLPSRPAMLDLLLAAKREATGTPYVEPTVESLSPLLEEPDDFVAPVPVAVVGAGAGGAGRKSSMMPGANGLGKSVLLERDGNVRKREVRGSEVLGKSLGARGRVSKAVA